MTGSLKGKINCHFSPQGCVFCFFNHSCISCLSPSTFKTRCAGSDHGFIPTTSYKEKPREQNGRDKQTWFFPGHLSQPHIIFGSVTFLILVWHYLITTNDLPSDIHWEPAFLYVERHQGRSPTSPTATSSVSGTEDTKLPPHHHRSVWKGCTSSWSSLSLGTTNIQHSTLVATRFSAVTVFLRDRLLRSGTG